MLSRRDFLRTTASAGITSIPLLSISAMPAKAWVMTAISVAGAVGSLFSKGGGGGLDPATQAYLDRITQNQKEISNQLSNISNQLVDLAELTILTPPQTVLLDREVAAAGIYSAAVRLEFGFVSDVLFNDNPEFGPVDRDRYTQHLEDIRRSASEHEKLAQTEGQSLDVISSIELLRLSMKSMIIAARSAGFTTAGDKRQLRDYSASVSAAASIILEGNSTPKLGKFLDEYSDVQKQVDELAKELEAHSPSRGKRYEISAPHQFFRLLEPKTSGGHTYVDFTQWEEEVCEGFDEDRRGTSGYCARLADDRIWDCCVEKVPGETETRTSERRSSASLSKQQMPGDFSKANNFTIQITPKDSSVAFVDLLGRYNQAKALEYVYDASNRGLEQIVASTEETIRAIDQL